MPMNKFYLYINRIYAKNSFRIISFKRKHRPVSIITYKERQKRCPNVTNLIRQN